MTTKVSSTYLFKTLAGCSAVCIALTSKVLHVEVGHFEVDGWPHDCSLQLFKEPALKWKICGLKTKLQQADMLCSHGCSMIKFLILFHFSSYDVDGRNGWQEWLAWMWKVQRHHRRYILLAGAVCHGFGLQNPWCFKYNEGIYLQVGSGPLRAALLLHML